VAESEEHDDAAELEEMKRQKQEATAAGWQAVEVLGVLGDVVGMQQMEFAVEVSRLVSMESFMSAFAKDSVSNRRARRTLLRNMAVAVSSERHPLLAWHAAASAAGKVRRRLQEEGEARRVAQPKPNAVTSEHAPARQGLSSSLDVYDGGSRPAPAEHAAAQIAAVYQAKALADTRMDRHRRDREAFPDFISTHLIRQFGLRSIALDHLRSLAAAVRNEHETSPRLQLFGKVSGILEPASFDPGHSDVILEGLKALFDDANIEARFAEDVPVALSQIETATLEVMRSRRYFADDNDLERPKSATGDKGVGSGPRLSQGVREQLAQLARPGSAAGVTEGIRLDTWLDWLLKAYTESKRNASLLFEALFDRFDEKKDGVLELNEFATVIRAGFDGAQGIRGGPEGQLEEIAEQNDKVIRMFRQALDYSGQGDRISKAAFVHVALEHRLPCWGISSSASGGAKEPPSPPNPEASESMPPPSPSASKASDDKAIRPSEGNRNSTSIFSSAK